MNYSDFLKNNLVKKVTPNFDQIHHQLKRSLQDLETAEANLKIDTTWALTITYHAMMRACRALMYSKGYLPTVQQSHKTIIQFTSLILGHQYDELIVKFNRLRRRRHDFIYDSENHVNVEEAKAALKTASELIHKIKLIIGAK